MSVKEAMETYFQKLNEGYRKQWGTPPTVPYNKMYPSGLEMPETEDAEGYVQWKPQPVEQPVDFTNAEKTLGFSIHPQIKEYYSAYYCHAPEGILYLADGERVHFTLHGIKAGADIEKIILRNWCDEETQYLTDHPYFLLGTFCCIGGCDSFLVEVNNDTGEVTAVEVMDEVSVHLADSIEELLYNMQCIWQ